MASTLTPRLVSRQLSRQLALAASKISTPRVSLPPASTTPSVPLRAISTASTAPHHAATISVIKSNVDTASDEFRENFKRMAEAASKVQELTQRAQQGGSQKDRQRQLDRGKMLPRHRIRELIDPGTTFLELSPLAGYKLYPEADVPAGGIITGVGVVEGVTCVIVANDSTVKGGSYFPITVKKHLRAQEVAEQNQLP